MTILYIILIVIGSLVALFFLMALINSKDLTIEKSVVINRPKNEVYDFLKITRNADKFNVWNQMDPDMKKEYRGTDGTVGFVYAWDSNKKRNVGAGEQETKALREGEYIEYELRFIRPMNDVAKACFNLESTGASQTKVTWTFKSIMKFPGTAMKGMIKGMLTKSLQGGLDNLKKELEKN
jgi:hypothetical protein